MTSRTWIARAAALEAPEVGSVNLQVRTGMSVPFSTYMVSEKAAESQTKK